MKKSIKKGFITAIALVLILASCSKDDNSPEPEQKVVLSSAKQLTGFTFSAAGNTSFAQDVTAIINEEAKTITATLPSDADLSALTPTLAVSTKASVSPTGVQDFTSPVTYIVTAEDGSETTYIATVIKPLSQKEVLQAILDANPNNELNWDLPNTAALDLGTLEGVTTDAEGVITALAFFEKKLIELPIEIGGLVNLKHLSLFDNDLTTVPSEIGNLVNLEYLVFSINKLTSIPAEIGNLVNLKELSFDRNLLTTIPTEISNLINLEYLSLASNELTIIPNEIGNLAKLKELDLSNNKLTTIPNEIGNLAKLEKLFLGINELTAIPTVISNIADLKELNLASNKLTTVPIEIGNLVHLERLFLFGNSLLTVPSEIGFLTSLQFIDLSLNNDLTSIPQAVCNLETYNNMIIFKDANVPCEITSPKDALISIYSANPNNTLDWGVGNFSGVTFDSQQSIVDIDLKDKGIERITSGVATLESLELLDVRDNPLASIHNDVCALTLNANLTLLADAGEGCN